MNQTYRFLTEQNGRPCHLHQIKVGEEWKNATGASTIVGVLDKPLTWWASGMAVGKFGWVNPKLSSKEQCLEAAEKALNSLDGITVEQYLDKLDEAYRAHSVRLTDSAEAGTDMHAELESYVKACMYNNEGKPMPLPPHKNTPGYLLEFAAWACADIKRFIWSEAFMYDQDLFVGGISDCGVELSDGSYAIIDFKSSKEAYFNHFCQIGIYNVLLEKNGLVDKHGEPFKIQLDKPISKYLVVPFGAKEFTVHENSNVESLKVAALACISLYRQKAYFEGK